MTALQKIESTLVVGGISVVAVASVYIGYKIYVFFKDPIQALDNTFEDLSRTQAEAGVGELLREKTHGVIDIDLKAIGTQGGAQNDYDRAKTLHEHKGAKTAIVGGSIAAAVATGGISLAAEGALVVATLATKGIDKKVRGGKDLKLAKTGMETTNEARSAYLAKESDKYIKARIDHTYDYDPEFIVDPFQFLTNSQKKNIDTQVAATIDKHHIAKMTTSQLGNVKKSMTVWHALKICQLEGMFLNDIDKDCINMKPLTFFNCLKKIINPHASVAIKKTRVDAVRLFVVSRNMSLN